MVQYQKTALITVLPAFSDTSVLPQKESSYTKINVVRVTPQLYRVLAVPFGVTVSGEVCTERQKLEVRGRESWEHTQHVHTFLEVMRLRPTVE